MRNDESRPAARPIVLTGPSGSGRGAVAGLIRARSSSVRVPVAVTTRAPRPGERPGAEREFVTAARFDALLAAGELLAPATIGPDRYAISRAALRRAGGHPQLIPLDPAGARQVRHELPRSVLVLLVPRAGDEMALTGLNPDVVMVCESVERVAAELLGLLGSSF
ncbi:guanylate kinase [Melissospora conviva]|uniref:guanylate kinase n=1 Tax=Melissospora conviva TaxID=3388432 RepID=UPI003B76ED9F